MTMNNDSPNRPKLEHLVWATGGALAGAWWVKNQVEESKQSRAERDDPNGVLKVCEDIDEILDQWEPHETCESEDDYVYDLADHLAENTDWEIEVMPKTPEGCPDILIDDALALEVKLNPKKAERDRCVGQCAGYSRQWVTWIVLIDTSASRIGHLENLLADKGLDRILIWDFN